MAKLFLSYSRKDSATARRLTEWLERQGHDVWRDDDDIGGGASFSTEIEKALNDSDAVLVLWSADSVQSAWVRDEAGIGRDAGKLIPLSLGGVDPPIGFRQFQSIDLGRRGRASHAAMQKIDHAIAHIASPQRAAAFLPSAPASSNRIPRGRIAAAAAALALLAAGAGAYLWSNRHAAGLTVAIVPAAGQSGAAGDFANSIATDMAAFLSVHANSASVLDPGDPAAKNATYRFVVSYSGEGPGREASLTMAALGQEGIVWSQSWSADQSATVDLKKRMSFGASRALLCALEARDDRITLSASLLKLYVAACSGLYGGDAPLEQLASNFSQIANQQPRFAPAWQNLAIVRSMIFVGHAADDGVKSPALRNQALEAIARARELSPHSGKVLLAEANLVSDDWQRELPLLDKAIAVEPNESMFYTARSEALQNVGRMQDSTADAERAVELDPLSPLAAAERVDALMYAGRLTNARDALAEAYRIWPNSKDLEAADLGFSMRYGDPRHGEQLISKVVDFSDQDSTPIRKVLIAREDPTPKNIEDALNEWRMAMNSFPPATTHYLLALGTFGKMDEAFSLASDPKARPFVIPQTFFRPEFEAFRNDPRFMAVAAQYGLVRYWRSTGNWPDFCGDDSLRYDCKTEAAKYGG